MNTGIADRSIGFVSTYPPTVCGLASYTASLLDSIARNRRTRRGLGVVSLTKHDKVTGGHDVVAHHRVGDPSSLSHAVRILNTYAAVSIQHEFGIFGGVDGEEVLNLMARLEVPTSVTMHTVLDNPSPHQRSIIEELAAGADRTVVMSQTGVDRLTLRYDVSPDRIEMIPHGADARFGGPSLVTGDRPLILTWGLIGPGKGLEAAIDGFANLIDLDPLPRYLIAGATHPDVVAATGETYRQGLMARVDDLGLSGMVEFDGRYRDRPGLARLVRSAELVVLPYESVEQVTSGVLVEAIAAGKPVVATRFPHALELLSGGAGATVPHGDPTALGMAVRRLLTDHAGRAGMAKEARRLADGWFWPSIGGRFDAMISSLASGSVNREVNSVAG